MNDLTRRPLLARLGAALALAAVPASADDWRARWAYRAMIRTSISGQKASQLIHAVDPQKAEAEATRAADRLLRIYVELSERRGKTYEEAFQLVLALAEARAIHPPDGALAVEVAQLVDAVDELALTMGRSANDVWVVLDRLTFDASGWRERSARQVEAVRQIWEKWREQGKSGHPADLIIVDDIGIDRAAGCSPHFPMDFTGPLAAGASKPSILTTPMQKADLLRGINVVEGNQARRRRIAAGIAVEWPYSAEEVLGVVNAADGDGELAVRAMKETWDGWCSPQHLQRAWVFARNARSREDASSLPTHRKLGVELNVDSKDYFKEGYVGLTSAAAVQNAFDRETADPPKPRRLISESERERRNKARKTAKQARRKNRGR